MGVSIAGFDRKGAGGSYVKRKGCWSYLLGVLKGVSVPVRVLSFKGSTASRSVLVPFRVLGQESMSGGNMLCKNSYLLGEKKISIHAHRRGFCYLLPAPLPPPWVPILFSESALSTPPTPLPPPPPPTPEKDFMGSRFFMGGPYLMEQSAPSYQPCGQL